MPARISSTVTRPALSLDRFPPEIRRDIFRDVSRSNCSRNLLAALRPTNKFSSLYSEALETYYEVTTCILEKDNQSSIKELSSRSALSVKDLKVRFSPIETSQRRAKCSLHRVDPGDPSSWTTHRTWMEMGYIRIHPKPSFTTIAAFSNIQILRLSAAAIHHSRFHQIEAVAVAAIKSFPRLERLEMRSDLAEILYRRRDFEMINGGWVERINNGTGIRAKLTRVSSYDMNINWFWADPAGRELLTWQE